MKPLATIESIAPNVHTVKMRVASGFEQWFLLSSDRHNDNLHSDQKLQRKHLDQASDRRAGIIDIGDLHCAMQGKWDKRADQNQMRDELRGNDYLKRLRKYNREFYAPWKENFLLLTPGNHETAMTRHHGEDLTKELGESLGVATGTYAGWIRFEFEIYKTQRQSFWMYRHHGYGGGGAVTKGVIQTNRMAVYLPDATFVVSGHTHDQWIFPLGRQRISQAGVPFRDEQLHLKCGGYKEEFEQGEGWHVERGGEPKPLGAIWLRFWYEKPSIRYEAIRTA